MTIREIERSYGEHKATLPWVYLALIVSVLSLFAGASGGRWLFFSFSVLVCLTETAGWWWTRAEIRAYDRDPEAWDAEWIHDDVSEGSR